jgi:methionyl-tRNA formyltransferase
MTKILKWGFAGAKPQGYDVLRELINAGIFPSIVFLPVELSRIETRRFTLLCSRNKIPVFKTNAGDIRCSLLRSLDFLLVCRFGIFQPKQLKALRRRALNIHSSLLPEYKGVHPVSWAIIKGESETGVTIHHLTHKLDSGNIVLKRAIKINPNHDVISLTKALNRLTIKMVIRFFHKLLRRKNIPRGYAQASAINEFYARRRSQEDSVFKWTDLESVEIFNLSRALKSPYPLATCHLESGKAVQITKVDFPEEFSCREPDGTIVAECDDWYHVNSKGFVLRIKCLQTLQIGDKFL